MAQAGAAQRGATQAAYQLADDIRKSAETSIAKAKDGLNAIGQTAVDVGATLTEMGIDKAKSQLFLRGLDSEDGFLQRLQSGYPQNVPDKVSDLIKLLPLAGRNYGKNSQLARQDGTNPNGAAVYGITTAITDAAIEKAFDGLNEHYGKAWAEKAAENFANLFKNNPVLQKFAKAGFNDVSEGVLESLSTDLAEYLLKSTYAGGSSSQDNVETEWSRVGRNVLINTIIGVLSGDAVWKTK
ncbi:MAG: hypothetical protein J6M06_00705 [Synergistaceae bacterium]|nr:hypothetical protein [Synergistaceae bacterium]